MILEIFVVYIFLMLLLGIYEYRKTKGVLDFYIAGKRLGVLAVSFSFFATYFSTAAFLGGGGSGYLMGFQWSAFLIFFHILFAILSWYIIAPPMKRIAEEYGAITIPELFGKKFGKEAQILSSLVILIFFEFYMVSIYKGAGNLLEAMLSINYRDALLISAFVVIFYTAIGGFRAVVTTDIVQGFIMFFGAILLLSSLLYSLGGLQAIEMLKNVKVYGNMDGSTLFEFGKLGPPPVMNAGMVAPFILSLTFAISVAQLASPQLVLRFIAAKNERVISYGMVLTPIIVGIFAICVFSVGPFGWLVIPKEQSTAFLKDTDKVVPYIAIKVLPESVNAILLTAIIAAAMSTINSLVHIAATAFVRDLIQNVRSLSEKTSLAITRVSVFVFALIPIIFAFNPPGVIVDIVGVSFSVITSAFLVPLISALYLKNASKQAIIASMVTAVFVCVVWHLYFYRIYFIYPVVPGLAASFLAFLAFNFKRKD